MSAPELFGVVVRTISFTMLLSCVPMAAMNPYVGALYAIAGAALLATSDRIVRLFYWQRDWRKHV